VVGQMCIEYIPQFLFQFRRLYRTQHLHPGLKVTLHGIGRGDKIFVRAIVSEIVDAGVLQKTADNADDTNIFRKAGNTGPQATGIAHNQVNSHTRHGSLVERLDNIAILQGVHLELDQTSAGFGVLSHLAFDAGQKHLLQQTRSGRYFLIIAFGHKTGRQIVEEFGHILSDGLVAGQ